MSSKAKKKPNKPEQLRSKLAKAKMINALAKTEGNVSKACEIAKCSRTQHYDWIKVDKKYAESVYDIDEADIDEVEDLLKRRGKGFKYFERKKIYKDGKLVHTEVTEKTFAPSVDALKARLAAKGRKRGYGKHEIDHNITTHHITLDLGDGIHEADTGEVSDEDS